MRVVHINADTHLSGGATIAMLRMNDALKDAGVESYIVCKWGLKDKDTYFIRRGVLVRFKCFLLKIITHLFWRHSYSSGFIATGAAELVNSLKPDVVHLHWIQMDTIGIRELLKIKAPIVWSMHDMWPICGDQGYPDYDWHKTGCFKGANFMERLIWMNKRHVFKKLGGNLYGICASRWMTEEARSSILFREHEIATISLPINGVYSPIRRNALVPKKDSKFVILFGAMAQVANPLKGFDRLIAAICLFPKVERGDILLRIFGCDGFGDADIDVPEGITIEFLGRKKPSDLVEIYSSASVFAFPSRKETFGQTKLEALCCGTPVVTFDETAAAEGVEHKVNGWVARSNDINDFYSGLDYFYKMQKDGRLGVVDFDSSRYYSGGVAKELLGFYEKVRSMYSMGHKQCAAGC